MYWLCPPNYIWCLSAFSLLKKGLGAWFKWFATIEGSNPMSACSHPPLAWKGRMEEWAGISWLQTAWKISSTIFLVHEKIIVLLSINGQINCGFCTLLLHIFLLGVFLYWHSVFSVLKGFLIALYNRVIFLLGMPLHSCCQRFIVNSCKMFIW